MFYILIRFVLNKLNWKKRFVIASCALIAQAIPGLAQTPILIQDFVSNDQGEISKITGVRCRTEGKAEKEGTGCKAKIGDIVSLEVQSLAGWLEKLKIDKIITSAETGDALVVEQLPNLRLFIGGHMMATLQPSKYQKDDPKWYGDAAQSKLAVGRSYLEFALKRDSANKNSRTDWDQILRTSGISPIMPLAIGIYNPNRNIAHVMALPPGTDKINPRLEFHFQQIAWDWWTIFGVFILVVAVIGFWYLLMRTGIVRDTSCAVREDGLPPLSLGRCQMGFWFFLVICAFYYLWLVTGRGDTDTINSTILILIGISAGTALGSALVSTDEGSTSTAKSQAVAAAYPTRIKEAQTTLAALKTDRKKIDPNNKAAIQAKDAEIETQSNALTELKAELTVWRKENQRQLWLDLLSEQETSAGKERVITFHRFQIVVWTLILGVVFVSEVLTKLAMPQFDATLLTLMGISSGTYLGFKVSAK
jgi:hypothetical protein